MHSLGDAVALLLREFALAIDFAVKAIGKRVTDVESPFGIEFAYSLVRHERGGALIDPIADKMGYIDKPYSYGGIYAVAQLLDAVIYVCRQNGIFALDA